MDDKGINLVIDAIKEVRNKGYGEVRIIIKDKKILDIIPSPRIRVEEEGQGRTHAEEKRGLDE